MSCGAGLSPQIAPLASSRSLDLLDLETVRLITSSPECTARKFADHGRATIPGSRSSTGFRQFRSHLAERSESRGLCCRCAVYRREAMGIIRALCMGGDVEPCSCSIESPQGISGSDACGEEHECPASKPHSRPKWIPVLARREL